MSYKLGDLVYVRMGDDVEYLARVEANTLQPHAGWPCEILVRHIKTGYPHRISTRTTTRELRAPTVAERLAERLRPTQPGNVTYPDVIARLTKKFDLVPVAVPPQYAALAASSYVIYLPGAEWPIAAVHPNFKTVYTLEFRTSQVNKRKLGWVAATAAGVYINVDSDESILRIKREVHPLVQLAAQAEEDPDA